MNKEQVKKIEYNARKLMNGYIPKGRIPIVYFYILQDANFHPLNEQLTRTGKYGPFTQKQYDDGEIISNPKAYGSNYADNMMKEYFRAGGRTFEL